MQFAEDSACKGIPIKDEHLELMRAQSKEINGLQESVLTQV